MDNIYFAPESLEERLLQGEIHKVMLGALHWAFEKADTETPKIWNAWDGMNLAQAYRISRMVAKKDPSLTPAIKIRLNQISFKMGKTLRKLSSVNFESLMGDGGPW